MKKFYGSVFASFLMLLSLGCSASDGKTPEKSACCKDGKCCCSAILVCGKDDKKGCVLVPVCKPCMETKGDKCCDKAMEHCPMKAAMKACGRKQNGGKVVKIVPVTKMKHHSGSTAENADPDAGDGVETVEESFIIFFDGPDDGMASDNAPAPAAN